MISSTTSDHPKETHNEKEALTDPSPKRIWIDLDNSPHVPFFAPIVRELRHRGYSVSITARDAYQVCELATLFHLDYECVGHHWGKQWISKALGTFVRAAQLLPRLIRDRPALAVAHGSRAQTIACSLLRIPSLLIYDYEFTNSLVLFKPTCVMTPDVMTLDGSDRWRGCRTLQYPGIKEDVYAPSLKPDPSVMARLGLDDRKTIVLVRPPASEAHYHNPKSDELFRATIEFLAQSEEDVQVIVLPRNRRQGTAVLNSWPEFFSSGKLSIPEHAEDGLNLIWHSDLVISGGGTMNREAAALGVPVYSIFRGKIGAVDHYLADHGRLVLVESADEIRSKIRLSKRVRKASALPSERPALTSIVSDIVALASESPVH